MFCQEGCARRRRRPKRIQMEPGHGNSVWRGSRAPNLRGLLEAAARSALGHVESQQSVLGLTVNYSCAARVSASHRNFFLKILGICPCFWMRGPRPRHKHLSGLLNKLLLGHRRADLSTITCHFSKPLPHPKVDIYYPVSGYLRFVPTAALESEEIKICFLD